MICKKCKIDKNETEFSFRRDTGKYRTICKSCKREQDKKYYNKVKEEAEYRENRHENYIKRKPNLTKYKDYPIERKKKINEYRKNKRENDLSFRIISNLRASLSSRLSRIKKSSTYELLGCSSGKEVLQHLISTINITEDDFLLNRADFHIDHIIPLSLYDIEDESEMKKAWNIRNLRLITKEENLIKGDTLDENLILEYNIKELLPRGIDENYKEGKKE